MGNSYTLLQCCGILSHNTRGDIMHLLAQRQVNLAALKTMILNMIFRKK